MIIKYILIFAVAIAALIWDEYLYKKEVNNFKKINKRIKYISNDLTRQAGYKKSNSALQVARSIISYLRRRGLTIYFQMQPPKHNQASPEGITNAPRVFYTTISGKGLNTIKKRLNNELDANDHGPDHTTESGGKSREIDHILAAKASDPANK